jgi:hypothetical protein
MAFPSVLLKQLALFCGKGDYEMMRVANREMPAAFDPKKGPIGDKCGFCGSADRGLISVVVALSFIAVHHAKPLIGKQDHSGTGTAALCCRINATGNRNWHGAPRCSDGAP